METAAMAMKTLSEKLRKEETASAGGVAEITDPPLAMKLPLSVVGPFAMRILHASLFHSEKKVAELVAEWGSWRQWGRERKYDEFNQLMEKGYKDFVADLENEADKHKKKKEAEKYRRLLNLLRSPSE